MDKTVSSLEYLTNAINKADGIYESIYAVIGTEEKLKEAQTTREIRKRVEKDNVENPEKLVEDIKAAMNSITEMQQESIIRGFEQVNDSIKKRLLDGEKISSVEITDKEVTIKKKDDDEELGIG